MAGEDIRTEPLWKYRAACYPHDPALHGGVEESVESMRARLDEEWPKLLAQHGVQAVGTAVGVRPTDIYEDGELPPGQRRLVRGAWVVALAVPADLAARVNPEIMRGYVSWR